jgi:transketolase
MEPVAQKWTAFGFHTIDLDGNDIGALLNGLELARAETTKPTCLIARTTAGKGIKSLEGLLAHNLRIDAPLLELARAELGEK